jgi:hypothetical protein
VPVLMLLVLALLFVTSISFGGAVGAGASVGCWCLLCCQGCHCCLLVCCASPTHLRHCRPSICWSTMSGNLHGLCHLAGDVIHPSDTGLAQLLLMLTAITRTLLPLLCRPLSPGQAKSYFHRQTNIPLTSAAS